MRQFDYTVETAKEFDEAVEAIQAKSQERQFKVLAVHDVKSTLESKGFSREPMKIIEICNAGYVDKVLAKEIKIALMLPCPVVVYVESGKTWISTLRPSVLADFYPLAGINDIANEVDAIVRAIVDEAR